MIVSMNAKKCLIQQPFLIKTQNKIGLRRKSLDLIKILFHISESNIMLNVEIIKSWASKEEPDRTASFHHYSLAGLVVPIYFCNRYLATVMLKLCW